MRTSCPSPKKSAFLSVTIFALMSSCLTLPATNTAVVAKSQGFVAQPPFIEPAIPQSAFLQPKKPADGRDPFYPKSDRVYGVVSAPKTVPTNAPTAELALKGISGTPEQPLAIINNRNFSAGEENDVVTPAGRIRIRCIEINRSTGSVIIQVGGQTRELRLK